jgi:hypothetical protein
LFSQSAVFALAKLWRLMDPESSLVKEPTKRKTGFCSLLARAIAASPQGIQFTGLPENVLRKAEGSPARAFAADAPGEAPARQERSNRVLILGVMGQGTKSGLE